MKQLTKYLAFIFLCSLSYYNVHSQNPNWVMPGWNFQPNNSAYDPLPQNPAWPPGYQLGNYPNDWTFKYTGDEAQYSQAGYTGPNGDLMCFVVDGKLYDGSGWLVNSMRALPNWTEVKGLSEMLILPMGTSCTRFAIIYPSSKNNDYTPQNSNPSLLMAVYNTNLENTFNPFAHGALEGQGADGMDVTLHDIGDEFLQNHATPGDPEFQQVSGYQIAATGLIDNCYRYVLLCDGINMYRYKLDETGLHYDNYKYQYQVSAAAPSVAMRSEMDLIKLSSGNYRVAIPASASAPQQPGRSIRILDLNPSMEVITGTAQTISLVQPSSTDWVNMHGLEFSPNGRYLYFTHKEEPGWLKPMDIWDVTTQSLVSTSLPSSFNDFRTSYIERYGNELYLVNSDYIGRITGANNPGTLGWNPQFVSINSGYGSGLNWGGTLAYRHLFPTQVNDDNSYGDFENFSCECCERWLSNAVTRYVATSNQSWSPGLNPFGAGPGDVVIVTDEIRIAEGVSVDITDMEFRFMPEAEVVIEQADEGPTGAILYMDRTTFTANFECADKSDDFCEDCDERHWKGVRVMGINSAPQSFSNTVQGKLVMRNSSMIEHAEVGVRAGSTSPGWGGGIVDVQNSTFKDNRNSITFDTYVRTDPSVGEIDNASKIVQNNFIITDDYLSSMLEPWSFISVKNSSGLVTMGNVFDYQKTTGVNIMKGIYATGSKLMVSFHCALLDPATGCLPANVTRTEFRNLLFGMDVQNGVAAARKVHIGYAQFFQNKIGARLNGTINAEVLDNEFELMTSQSSQGILLHSSTGYAVENNTFTTAVALPGEATGIVVTSSGGAYNEIYRNQFRNLSTGIQTQGVNATQNSNSNFPGLEMYCNTFDSPILYDDIYVRTGNISDMQGYCNDLLGPRAGNLFSHSHINSSSQHFDFRIDQGAMANLEVKYNHHAPTDPRLEPLVYTFNPGGIQVNPFNCTTQFDRETCPVKKSGGPTAILGGPGEGPLGPFTSGSFNDFQNLATAFDDSLSFYQSQLDGGNTMLILQLIDEGSSEEDILDILEGQDGPLSATLINALDGPGIELPGSADISIAEASASSDVSDEIAEAEEAWHGARRARTLFWRSVVDIYQTDTTGIFTANELYDFINNHEPEGIERFTSVLAYQLDVESPSWIADEDKVEVSAVLPVSASESEDLPQNLDYLFEGDFFDSFSNAAMLSQLYVDADQYFDSYVMPHSLLESAAEDGEQKSAGKLDADAAQAVKAYPNPFNDQITFAFRGDFKTAAQVRITFHDITGREIQQQQLPLEVKSFTIDGSALPQGMLFYSIEVDGKHLQTGKLVHMK